LFCDGLIITAIQEQRDDEMIALAQIEGGFLQSHYGVTVTEADVKTVAPKLSVTVTLGLKLPGFLYTQMMPEGRTPLRACEFGIAKAPADGCAPTATFPFSQFQTSVVITPFVLAAVIASATYAPAFRLLPLRMLMEAVNVSPSTVTAGIGEGCTGFIAAQLIKDITNKQMQIILSVRIGHLLLREKNLTAYDTLLPMISTALRLSSCSPRLSGLSARLSY
jgi:hypothetical protein